MWRGTCKEVLGRRKPQHKEWIHVSADTLKRLGVRKEKKAALNSLKRAAKTKAQEEN